MTNDNNYSIIITKGKQMEDHIFHEGLEDERLVTLQDILNNFNERDWCWECEIEEVEYED